MRKEWHDKAMVPGKGAMLVGSACRACGKGPSPGRPLKACAACHALHTGAERQRASWKDHKAVCRADAVNKKGMATDGVDAKRGSGHDWYSYVPNLGVGVMKVAWEQCKDSPIMTVQGGVKQRTRADYGPISKCSGQAANAGWAARQLRGPLGAYKF